MPNRDRDCGESHASVSTGSAVTAGTTSQLVTAEAVIHSAFSSQASAGVAMLKAVVPPLAWLLPLIIHPPDTSTGGAVSTHSR